LMHTEIYGYISAGKCASFWQHSLCNQKVGGSIPSAGTDRRWVCSGQIGPHKNSIASRACVTSERRI
jgi:hypothetical protein